MECPIRPSLINVLPLWTLAIGVFNMAGLRPGSLSVRADPLDTFRQTAVSGGETTLPCDAQEPQPPDALLLIVWYKNDVPIYSYDSRLKGSLAHWSDASLNGRAAWHSGPHSALRLRDIVPADRALYRCRVDYKITPTLNQKVFLEVIELPHKPKIFNERDVEVVGVAGPYEEDSSLRLTCIVSGGNPMPTLKWLHRDEVVAKLDPVEDGSRLSVLELRIPRLTREYFEAVFTCAASNTILVSPLRASVQVQMYLRPLFVEILAREQPLAVGTKAELACRAVGSRPPAVITWSMGKIPMVASDPQKDSEDRNETVSFLRWIPRMDHNGREITCRATHPKLEHSTLQTSTTLDLHFAPIVTLQLGSKLNPNDIEEGDDVYFECLVRSNPPAYKVVWEHNGQLMTHNQRAGVIAGSAHLALQGVSREQAGRYICTASNVEGDGRSATVNLQIIYKPICKNPRLAIVGAAIHEATRVSCEVDAFPPPKNFQWILNNTYGTTELEPVKYTIDSSGRSILSFTPSSDADYGSLICRATNLAGQQMKPCRYKLLPAVRPEPPSNCTTLNLTDDSADIKCIAGYDGGLQTTYFVEAWDSKTLVANVSTIVPSWKLRGLGPGKTLKLLFYANNARGRSEVTFLKIRTLSTLALLTEEKAINVNTIEAGWLFGILAGTLGTLAIVVIFLLVIRRNHHAIQYEAPIQLVKTNKSSMGNANHSPGPTDDKNPDVVPLGKDFNCTRDTERPPDPPPYGAVVSPPVVSSRSANSLHEGRSKTPHTPVTPASDVQSISMLTEDQRSVTSGTLSRRREIVTTRTPLLANARESCV